MDELISHMQSHLEDLRELLQQFEREQDGSSDEGNEDHISQAVAALDALEGHVGDLVP
jgi:hypothetical protein